MKKLFLILLLLPNIIFAQIKCKNDTLIVTKNEYTPVKIGATIQNYNKNDFIEIKIFAERLGQYQIYTSQQQKKQEVTIDLQPGKYEVHVIWIKTGYYQWCRYFIEIIKTTSTSSIITELNTLIYPNPCNTNSILNIPFSKNIELIDIQGNIINCFNNTDKVTTPTISGNYILKYDNNNDKIIVK